MLLDGADVDDRTVDDLMIVTYAGCGAVTRVGFIVVLGVVDVNADVDD